MQYLTHAFSRKVEILSLQFREDFQELLEKPNKLGRNIILILPCHSISIGPTYG